MTDILAIASDASRLDPGALDRDTPVWVQYRGTSTSSQVAGYYQGRRGGMIYIVLLRDSDESSRRVYLYADEITLRVADEEDGPLYPVRPMRTPIRHRDGRGLGE